MKNLNNIYIYHFIIFTFTSVYGLSSENSFTYSYFGNPVEMQIHAEMVAVPLASKSGELHNLDELMINGTKVSTAIGDVDNDWRTIIGAKGQNLSARELTSELIRSGVSFVSPILTDAKGRDTYITQRIWITLPYKMEEKEKKQILGSIRDQKSLALISSPVKTQKLPIGNPSKETTWLDHAGNPDGNELYAVDVMMVNGFEILDEVEVLATLAGVVAVEPDFVAIAETSAVATPNDPLYLGSGSIWGQWYLWGDYTYGEPSEYYDYSLDARNLWELGYGYSSIKLAIFDSGIQTDHPDLTVSGGMNFTDVGVSTAYGPTQTYENHGTAVAGVINGIINNSTGIAGLAPNVRIYSLKIGKNYTSSGTFTTTSTWVVNAIIWCANNNIRVTNNSNHFSSPWSAVSTEDTVSFPASSAGVIAVGATHLDGTRADFSNYGSGLDIVAPGIYIQSTDRTGSLGYDDEEDYSLVSGTSFASPLTAATAALILSKNPGLTAVQVEEALENTARDLSDEIEFGSGLIQPIEAVNSVTPGLFYTAGFVNDVDGWKFQDTFGWVLDEEFPIYKHVHLGWQYTTSTNPNSIWLWDYQSTDWWWINIGTGGSYPFPWVKRQSDNTWYWYQQGSCCPRWFYNSSTEEWVNF